MSRKGAVAALLVVLAIAGVALLAWYREQRPLVAAPPPLVTAPDYPDHSTHAEQAASLPASAPAVQFPVPAASAAPAAAFDPAVAFADLIGRKATDGMLQGADFPRRFVATVDNLGRTHAPPSMWPIQPMPGRFLLDQRGDTTVINPANSARYAPLVRLIDGIDIDRAVALYVRAYPLLQQAYEEIGYPNRYFNDRFVEVIDALLATPQVTEPIPVRLTEVKGPIESKRPWVRYEFADPALEALTSGQKIMLRIGTDNRRRLEPRLVALRRALTGSAVRRP